MRAKCTIHPNKFSLIFGLFHKIAKSDYFFSSCLSVRMGHFVCHWKDFCKI